MIRIAKNGNPAKRYVVALATRDSRLRYRILKLLNRLKLKYVVCSPDDSECEMANVIVTTKDEALQFDETSLVVVENDSNDEFILSLMMKINNIHTPMNMVLGIDPGFRFGLAMVVDGITIHTRKENSPILAAEITMFWINYMKHNFLPNQIRIRIGTGSRLYSILYLREILRRDDKLVIELVNEQNTTRIGKSDQSSAILIAGRWGKTLDSNPDLSLDPKGGYISALKRLVSHLTDGRKLLSTEEARSIIRDEKPLNYFLNQE